MFVTYPQVFPGCESRQQKDSISKLIVNILIILFSGHILHTAMGYPEMFCSKNLERKHSAYIQYIFSLPLLIRVWQERLADELFNCKGSLKLTCTEIRSLLLAEMKLISSATGAEELGETKMKTEYAKMRGPGRRSITASALYLII